MKNQKNTVVTETPEGPAAMTTGGDVSRCLQGLESSQDNVRRALEALKVLEMSGISSDLEAVQYVVERLSRNEDLKDYRHDFEFMLEKLQRANSLIVKRVRKAHVDDKNS